MTVSEKRLGQFIQGVDLYELAQEYDLGCIEHDLKEMAQELLEARQLAQDMKCLRKLMRYVENGSDQTVELFQDDATRDFFVKTGAYRKENSYWGHSLHEAIQKAFEAEGDRK